jgi:hypothetical protein
VRPVKKRKQKTENIDATKVNSNLAISFYHPATLRAAKGLVAALKVSPGVNCKKSFVVINVVPQVALKVLDSSHNYHDKSIFFRRFHYFLPCLLS